MGMKGIFAVVVLVIIARHECLADSDDPGNPPSLYPSVAAITVPATAIHTSSVGGVSIEDFDEQGSISKDAIMHDFIRSKAPTHSKEIHVEDFLWTGSGDGDPDDYDDLGGSQNRVDVQFVPTTLVVTSTVFIQPTATHGVPNFSTSSPGGVSPIRPPEDSGTEVRPTRVLPPDAYTSVPPHIWPKDSGYQSLEGEDTSKRGQPLPQEEYLVRTILLSNMTIIHNRIEHFKHLMEEKLTKAFSTGLQKKSEVLHNKRRESGDDDVVKIPGRHIRDAEETFNISETTVATTQAEVFHHRFGSTRVQIHNIRSSLPRPEIEMIYTVYQDDGEPMSATDAVQVLETVRDDDVETLLGFPLLTKAEPYTARPQALIETDASQASLMIAVVIVSAFLVVVITLALLFLLYRAKHGDLPLKHSRFMGSPTVSSRAETRQDGSPTNTLDRSVFTLDRPLSKQSACVKVSSDVEDDSKPVIHVTSDMSRSPSTGARATAGGESPTMADMSSNNTPETSQRTKRPVTRRTKTKGSEDQSKYRRELTPTGYSSGGEVSQSAFPLHTPDKAGWLGPLTDLLEEDIVLPGDSRDNSASVVRGGGLDKAKNWAYLPPRSPTTSTTSSSDSYKDEGLKDSPPWHQGAAASRRLAKQYKKTLNDAFPKDDEDAQEDEDENGDEIDPSKLASPSDAKKRAVSAKSHIFRKGKVESKLAKMGKNSRTRPWSAHESRISSDPVFHMRQRHWEGLIAGKKNLHRGQLLPGSTSSEEDQSSSNGAPLHPATCWSECTSPRKQVRISEVPMRKKITVTAETSTPVPLIQAIKEELQKFHRAPNLTGISIINDPDLLQKESNE